MTRLFYDTDLDDSASLKIIYMAMNFGVKFEVNLVEVDGIDYTQKGKMMLYPAGLRGGVREDALTNNPNRRSRKYELYYASQLFRFGRFYVAPESKAIFEPKEGDLAAFVREDGYATVADYSRGNWANGNFKILKKYNPQIIMRDNKQFFSPTKEEKCLK